MILALDVGNTSIHGGVFEGEDLRLQFRKSTKQANSSDELGVFLRSVLRENGVPPAEIQQIAVCSVVPDIMHSLKGACRKYFGKELFSLQAGAKTGLKIKYRNPVEVGPDRIANGIAGTQLFPGKNLIIVDYGTATTFDVVSASKEYLGGLIMPGMGISMEALESKTARLPPVEIRRPEEVVGRSTIESIQAGLYYGNLYALRGIAQRIKKEYFEGNNTLLIGTGGFSRLFEQEKVFDHHVSELVLLGLVHALKLNS